METKFRAFQLNTDGSLFSFYKSNLYYLIEARLPKGGLEVLINDLNFHDKSQIDVLHITSWDNDHCNYDDLIQIINHLRPNTIEIPAYLPDTDSGKLCRKTIMEYDTIHGKYTLNVKVITKEYISSLSTARAGGLNNVVYHSKENAVKKNDMSLIKLFRSLGFNVLSLGDCECCTIADSLLNDTFITTEVDVLVLPHHGADNGFVTQKFIEKVNPKIAICSSNFGNQYEHPKQAIRNLLYQNNIPLYTTKTGDVHVVHEKGVTETQIYNMMSDNGYVSSKSKFTPKRHQ